MMPEGDKGIKKDSVDKDRDEVVVATQAKKDAREKV